MNIGNTANVTAADSSSFKYKSNLFKLLRATDNGVFKDVKIAVPNCYYIKQRQSKTAKTIRRRI